MESFEQNLNVLSNNNNLQSNKKKLIVVTLYIMLIFLVVLLGYIYGGARACTDAKGLYTDKLRCVTGPAMYVNNNDFNAVLNYAWLNTTIN